MNWKYEGITMNGEKLKGNLQVTTEQQALDRLKNMGFKSISSLVPEGIVPGMVEKKPLAEAQAAKQEPPAPPKPAPDTSSPSILFPSNPQPVPAPSQKEMAAVEIMRSGFDNVVKVATARLNRREGIFVGTPENVKKEVEVLLKTRNGKVKHAPAMSPDAMGRALLVLVVEYDEFEGLKSQ